MGGLEGVLEAKMSQDSAKFPQEPPLEPNPSRIAERTEAPRPMEVHPYAALWGTAGDGARPALGLLHVFLEVLELRSPYISLTALYCAWFGASLSPRWLPLGPSWPQNQIV